MSKQTNDALFLFSMALNHSSTERVLLHRFTLAAKAVFFTMLWSTYFATFPISDLAGLISRHVGELLKFGLWSFKVMKASRLAMVSILSANSNLSAIVFASSLIFASWRFSAFLYPLCMFLFRSSLYSLGFFCIHWELFVFIGLQIA